MVNCHILLAKRQYVYFLWGWKGKLFQMFTKYCNKWTIEKKNYPLLYSNMSQEYSMVLIDGKLRPQFSWVCFFFLNTNAYVTSL